MKSLLINFPLGHMANDWAPGSILMLTPAIAAAMGLSPSEIGLLLTVSYIGASVGYLPAGILSDRINHQGRMLAATFWWVAIGYLLASLAPGFWSLALLLALAGMGDAAWHPIATGVLVEQMPKRRGMVLGIHAMGGTFSAVGSPLAVGFLLTLFDWRTTLQISVVPAVLMGIVFVFYARHIPRSTATRVSRLELSQLTRNWLRPRGLLLIAMVSIYNMALMALMSMSPLFMQRELGFSPATAGMVFAAAMLAGSLLQPFVGRLSDSIDRNLIFIVVSIISIGLGIIAATGSQPWVLAFCIAGSMALLNSVRSGVLASAVEYAGTRAATTLGFVFVLLDGVGALGALLAGIIAESGLQNVYTLAAVLTMLSVVAAVFLHLRTESPITNKAS